MTTSNPLPDWSTYQSIMAKAEAALDRLADPTDPQARQEAYRLLFAAIATGYHSAFADPDLPDFVPAVSTLLNTIGANPDFIYGYTRIDGTGSYRLCGKRGGAIFVFVDFAAGGLGVLDQLGPSTGMLDLDQFTIAPDGSFDILLSPTRPETYTGDWFHLDPRTTTATLRRATYHWGDGEDTKIAIDRIDRPIAGTRLTAAEVASRLEALSGFVDRYVRFALAYSHRHRAQGTINRLEHDDWAGRGGVAGQHYYQGIFRLEPDQALIVEPPLPGRVRYWNIQLNDPLWNAIDCMNHQCSLNGGQAHIDTDGKFRAVIATTDPGIPNWLDPAGHLEGSMMLRWTEASSGPEPSLTLIPLADLRHHLPPDTPTISPAERQLHLRHRRRSAQWRRRW